MVWCIPQNIDADFDEVLRTNAKGQYVKVFIEEDIKDNYFGVIKEKEYRELLTAILDKYISSHKIFTKFTASYFRNDFNKDTMLRDALDSESYGFFSRSVIIVNESTTKEIDKKGFEAVRWKVNFRRSE